MVLVSTVSHHVLWQCQTQAPTDLFIDTGSAAQSLNPDSVQAGIRGDWKTQRLCSDAHLNKLVCKNTPVEDTSANVEEWDTDHSTADRELSKNTLDNHSTTANCLSQCLTVDKLRALENVTVLDTWNMKLVGVVSLKGPDAIKNNYFNDCLMFCESAQVNLHDGMTSVSASHVQWVGHSSCLRYNFI